MTLTATCHCGATNFEVPHAPTSATECNCSYCSKSGALWAYYKTEEFQLMSEENGGVYAKRGINEHHFCKQCGCATYGVTPNWTEADIGNNKIPEGTRISINVRLLDDFNVASLPIQQMDGRHLW